jgi:hypothetical protein
MSDEEIITNERLRREELGLDPDDDSPEAIKQIYGTDNAADGLGGDLGGGFGNIDLGMEANNPQATGGELPPPNDNQQNQ